MTDLCIRHGVYNCISIQERKEGCTISMWYKGYEDIKEIVIAEEIVISYIICVTNVFI
jgi:hypothetical protein